MSRAVVVVGPPDLDENVGVRVAGDCIAVGGVRVLIGLPDVLAERAGHALSELAHRALQLVERHCQLEGLAWIARGPAEVVEQAKAVVHPLAQAPSRGVVASAEELGQVAGSP